MRYAVSNGMLYISLFIFFFFQAEDGIRDHCVTGVQTCALPIYDEDNAEARNVAFLGSDTKKQLFAEREAMGQTVWMNGIPYVVIGVMKSKEQNSSYDGFDTRKIFIPFNSMRRDLDRKSVV